MRKLLAACLFSLALVAGAYQQVSAQDKVVDKTKDAGAAVADKAGDVKDATVKGAKATARGTKKVAAKTVDTTKAVGNKVADKTGDAADATAHGAKTAAHKTADKTEDAKDATVHGAKKTGNWFKRTWHKIF